MGVGTELDAFLFHYGDAPVHDPLFDLVVRDAVAEEAPDPIVLLEENSRVPGPVELLRRREPGRPTPHDGDPFARAHLRRRGLCYHPSLLEGTVDDRKFYLFDGDGLVVDGEYAGGLAGGGAEHARELGEVVGLVQAVDGLLPVLAVDEVVPVGDQVPQRTSRVAEGHAAIHATRRLATQLIIRHRLVDVTVVLEALLDGSLRGGLAPDLEEAPGIPH